jgi:hypothetical protein
MKANGARRPRLNNSRVPGARIVGAYQQALGFISRGHETGVPTLLPGVSFTTSSTLAWATGPMVLRRASDDQVRHCRSSLGQPNREWLLNDSIHYGYDMCRLAVQGRLTSCGDQMISTSDRGVSRRSLTHARPGRREPCDRSIFQEAARGQYPKRIQQDRIRTDSAGSDQALGAAGSHAESADG